jgi:hypothetical protein
MTKPRKEIYGQKKEFIINHYDDIMHLLRRKSARQVSELYGGLITKWDIYAFQKISKK